MQVSGPRPPKMAQNCVLVPLGAVLGHLDGVLGRLGGILGRLGGILGRLGAVLERLGAVLGPSWADFGRFGAPGSVQNCGFPVEIR